MGTMWVLHEVLKIACQHSIEAAPPDRGETSVMAQVKVIHDVTARIKVAGYSFQHLEFDGSL